MPVKIPLRSDLSYFDLQIALEAVNYTLLFRWNLRESSWYMDIYDEQGVTLIVAGLKLVADSLLGIVRTGRKPPGAFIALDTSGLGVDPGLNDLGVRVKLLYYTLAELSA